jgi:arylsulfatase A-like enzyme
MPLDFTILSEKLSRGANYSCHFVGKGHLGWNTEDHLLINRGFDSHVGYLGGAETYQWGGGDKDPKVGHHDFWSDHEPAIDLVPFIDYSANFYSERTSGIIAEHSTRKAGQPLWLHYTIQNVHAPYTLPMAWEVNEYPTFRGMKPTDPKEHAQDHILANMLDMLDSAMGNLTTALTTAQMWSDTLIVFSADNGGIGLGNNHPLRGHKHDPFEGEKPPLIKAVARVPPSRGQ